MSVWSPWINFFKLYDFYGLVNNKLPSDRKNIISWDNNKGKVLTDNGFRLRSKIYQRGSFKNLKPKISLKSIECNLNSKDIGVYCLRIIYPPYQTFNYVGMSAKTSIHERLLHHFIKISGTTEFAGGRHGSDTEEFIKMRSYFKTKGIDTSETSFFDKVEISLIKFKKSKKIESKLLKIEGMSIQLFKNKYGIIPELNARDDSAGMENFPYNVCI